MKRVITILLLLPLLSSGILLGQSRQRLRVVEYRGEKSKTPLANVEVVVQNAASSVTDKNGYCTLTFRTLKPGDKINVRRISKIGYELFNIEDTEHWYISRKDEVFTIVLIESKRFSKIQDEYRKVNEKAAIKQFERSTVQLNKQYMDKSITEDDYNKKLREIKNVYEQRLDNIENYLDQFTRVDLSILNKTEERITKYLREGDLDGAVAEYEKINLIDEYQRNIKSYGKLSSDLGKVSDALAKSEKRRNELIRSARREIDILNFAGGEENSKKAEQMIYEMGKADTLNYQYLLWAGDRLRKMNSIDKASEVLSYCTKCQDTILKNASKVILGALDISRGQYSRGYKKEKECLQALNELIEERQDSTYLLQWRTRVLLEMVRAQTRLIDSVEIAKYGNLSITEARKNVLLDPSIDNRRMLVECISHYSSCQSALSKHKEAYDLLQEALQLQTKLYEEYPRRQAAMLGYVYSRIGALMLNYKVENHYEQCIEAFDKACEYYKEAMSFNPIIYRKNYATTIGNLGTALVVSGTDYIRGIECHKEAREKYAESVDGFNIYTSSFYNNSLRITALAYFNLGQIEQAKKVLDDNFDNARQMYENDKLANRTYFYQYYVLYYRYYTHPDVNDLEKADECILKALEISPKSSEMLKRARERGLR